MQADWNEACRGIGRVVGNSRWRAVRGLGAWGLWPWGALAACIVAAGCVGNPTRLELAPGTRPAPASASTDAGPPAPLTPEIRPVALGSPLLTGQASPSPGTVDVLWRPAWWIDAPERQGDVVRVPALADAADLRTARSAALRQAQLRMRSEGAAERNDGAEGSEPVARIEVVQLKDGRTRVFVLLTGTTGGQGTYRSPAQEAPLP